MFERSHPGYSSQGKMWHLSHFFLIIISFHNASSLLHTATFRPRLRLMLQTFATEAFLDATASSAADRAAIDTFLATSSVSQLSEYVLCLEGDYTRMRNQLIKSKHFIVHQGTQLMDPDTKNIVGAVVGVDSAAGRNLAQSLINSVDWIVLTEWDPEVSVLLIAACEGSSTKIALFMDTKRLAWMPTVLFSVRPPAIVLEADEAVWKLYSNLQHAAGHKQLYLQQDSTPSTAGTDINRKQCVGSSSSPALIEGRVVDVRSGGIGDRVCLDLISLLHEGEGLLIGSDPNLLTLVHAETFSTEFVPARPFRVNAGSLHGCVLMADGSTKYLCEVNAGDQVAVVSATLATGADKAGGDSPWRPVAVGRCKTESRPMLLVEYETSSSTQRGSVFLQQAETVRLVSPISSDLPTPPLPSLESTSLAAFSDEETATGAVSIEAASEGTKEYSVPTSRRWQPLSVTKASIGDTIFLSAAPMINLYTNT